MSNKDLELLEQKIQNFTTPTVYNTKEIDLFHIFYLIAPKTPYEKFSDFVEYTKNISEYLEVQTGNLILPESTDNALAPGFAIMKYFKQIKHLKSQETLGLYFLPNEDILKRELELEMPRPVIMKEELKQFRLKLVQ